MGIFSSIIDLGNTLIGNHSAKKEAQANRDFQEEMSNTAVQRRVEDLKKAGLNPLLAVGSASGGASTPSGSQADIKRVSPDFLNAITNAKALQKESEVKDAQKKNIEAQTRNIEADTLAKENDNSIFEFKKRKAILENYLSESKLLTDNFQRKLLSTQNSKLQTEMLVNRARALNMNIQYEQAEALLQLLKIDLTDPNNTTTGRRENRDWNRFQELWRLFIPLLAPVQKNSQRPITINNVI